MYHWKGQIVLSQWKVEDFKINFRPFGSPSMRSSMYAVGPPSAVQKNGLPNACRIVDTMPEGRRVAAAGGGTVDPDGTQILAFTGCDTGTDPVGEERLGSDLDSALNSEKTAGWSSHGAGCPAQRKAPKSTLKATFGCRTP